MTTEIVGRARWSGRIRRLPARVPGRRTLRWFNPLRQVVCDPPSHGEWSPTPRRDGAGPPPVGESGAPQAPKTPPRALPGRRTTRRSVTRRDVS